MKIIILAGGGGTRLFPLSRTKYPKQFLKIEGKDSLLTQTVMRFLPLVRPADIVVVTNQEYIHHVKNELVECGADGAHIVLEPVARNTAPAIALAVRYCLDNLGTAADEVLFVTPSDHIIRPVGLFVETVRKAGQLAAGEKLVTLGIKPEQPETGYGYIQAGETSGNGYAVRSFKEKPDQKTAERYLAEGGYYWNSGMFAFRVDLFLQELEAYQPDIYTLAQQPFQEMVGAFSGMPNISIDYAIAEKSSRGVMLPLTAYWNDIGSWDAIYDVFDKDADGNALQGDCLPLDCSNTLMMGRSRLIAGIGLENLLIVETDDVIVVAKRGESQQVKELVNILKERGRREAEEHTTGYRPWGSWTVLGEGKGYKIKKITVNPGQRLSLQMHYHRSEHWVVIGGTAKVHIDGEEYMVPENKSIFVPQCAKHFMENPGKTLLEIIEVQNGVYLEEDDIVRFEDMYGRC
ncbi:Xanthan biosynthesis protein XanB [Propionispora sp. 2/2-37]|uniref:mannose-1-phosphate guanylyltransferase/mannose-6-phosphate isomerase n=1 Tax=Propionispora sp. 2/2-37 TaxID=1677858 RepID=UPI0006BB9885|nr:mannose-1-phosphate guanylyltransferase/mannose-6-phosphate isomerase [Propionispora sp. 2/2-37]CUH94461.1 Xanthan biosynthesis protein XanB [Propionispora sp. 2/2-37]